MNRMLRWNPAWLTLGLALVPSAVLYRLAGPDSAVWTWGSLASIAVCGVIVWALRRRAARRLGVVLALVALVGGLVAAPAPRAEAFVYPNGCRYVYHSIGVQEQGITVAWVYVTVDVCQGPAGNVTPSSFMTADIVSTSWGEILGYSFGTSGGVRVGANTPSLQTRSIDLWARVCLARITPICMPTDDFRVSAQMLAGNLTGYPYTPLLRESGYCMNTWCGADSWYLVAWLHPLSFTGALSVRVSV
jgi:hypothetical protein